MTDVPLPVKLKKVSGAQDRLVHVHPFVGMVLFAELRTVMTETQPSVNSLIYNTYFQDDGCNSICQIEKNSICNGEPSVCAICGDGILDATEECDDGNIDDSLNVLFTPLIL